MRTLFIATLAAVLLILITRSEALAEKNTAAVMPLAKGAGGAEFDGFGRALADMMVTDFSRADVLQLVERTQLKLILDELKLGKSGYLDKKKAQKLGRGLAAQFVITGTFSVTGEKFVMDCRVFAVESGAIVKSARSEGTIDEFVAVEKDVVEKLLVGLKVKLSLAVRRKLLIDTPTENAIALASYGRGLDAQEAGKLAAAQKAFKLAVSKDPSFGRAGDALRALAGSVKIAVVAEVDLGRTTRVKPMLTALKSLPSELTRRAKFADSADSLVDFAIRQQLLRNSEQHCQHYKELKHYLIRRKGEFGRGIAGLVPNVKGRRNFTGKYEARKLLKARRIALGVQAGDTVYKARGDRYFESTALNTVANSSQMLLSKGGTFPEARADLFVSMFLCYSDRQLVNELASLVRSIRKFPLWRHLSQDRGAIAVGDSILLYQAYVQASNIGISGKLTRKVDTILARYPSGHDSRGSILKRAEKIVEAGEQFTTRVATRGDFRRGEIVEMAFAVSRRDKRFFHQTPLCVDFIGRIQGRIDSRTKSYIEEVGERSVRFIPRGVSNMASDLHPLVYAGCIRRTGKALSFPQLTDLVLKRATRSNPDKGKPEHCPATVTNMVYFTNPSYLKARYSKERRANIMLVALQQNYRMRCLLRP